MREMPFAKLKAISHNLCKALDIPLLLLLQRLEDESRFPFSKKYLIFLK